MQEQFCESGHSETGWVKKFSNRFLILLSLIFCISLSGCGGGTQEGKKEIVMWLVGSEPQAQTVNAIGEEFFELTGINVRCESISWGEAHSKYLTSIAGDVAPDIGTMGLTWGTEFGSLGAMIDLAGIFAEDVQTMREKTFPGIWNSVEYKGKVYGIPFDMTEYVVYYRKDIISKAPETWRELVSLLENLNKQNMAMIFDWGSLNWIGYSSFLWQAGGNFYNQEGTEARLDSGEAAKALEFFRNLYTKYRVPKTNIPVEQGMRTADFPIAISGNWKIVGLTVGAPEIKDKWDIALLPVGPSGKRTSFIGGRVMGIFSKSKMKEEAWQFIKFLFKEENQIKLYQKALETQDAYLPPNIKTWETLPMRADFREILKTQAMDSHGPPSVLGWEASARFIDRAIQKAILKGESPEIALKEANASMNEELKRH